MGALFAGGWTVDQVLDLTVAQLGEVTRCVVLYQVERAEVLLELAAGALGVPVKPREGPPGSPGGPVGRSDRRGRGRTAGPQETPAEAQARRAVKDQLRMRKLAALGFRINEAPKPG